MHILNWLFGIKEKDPCQGVCKEMVEAASRNQEAVQRLNALISEDPVVMTIRLVESAQLGQA